MDALRIKIQDSVSDNLDPERLLISDVSRKREGKKFKSGFVENSGNKSKSERQKNFESEAFDFRRKGVFVCLVCFRRFTHCFKVKKHFIQEHPKAFCALGHENTIEPRIQAKLLLFCPKICQYVTLKMDAFTHHLATCLEPDFSSKDYVENQVNFVAENDDEEDEEDRQMENTQSLISETERHTTAQGIGLNPVDKLQENHLCKKCNTNFSSSHLLDCHMKLYHNDKSRDKQSRHKNINYHPHNQEKCQNVNTASRRSRWQAKTMKEGSSDDYLKPVFSRNDRVHKTLFENGLLKQSSQPDMSSTSSSNIGVYTNRKQACSKSRFTCRKCGMNFDKIQDFHVHMVMHERGKHSNRADSRSKDEKEHSTSPVRKLVGEQKKIFTPSNQYSMLNISPIFECVKCKKCFDQNKALLLHMRSHRAKLHQCHECSKVFKRSHCLSVHMRTHTGEKPCRCEVCGVSFRTMGALRMHLKRHRGDRPFQCNICGNKFGARSTLQTHIRTHTGERPYQCAECGKSFSQSGSLNLHMKIHTGEKPFKCEVCGRAFMLRVVLRKHMRTHTRDKPYKCNDCDREFSNGACFKWHLKSHQTKSSKVQ